MFSDHLCHHQEKSQEDSRVGWSNQKVSDGSQSASTHVWAFTQRFYFGTGEPNFHLPEVVLFATLGFEGKQRDWGLFATKQAGGKEEGNMWALHRKSVLMQPRCPSDTEGLHICILPLLNRKTLAVSIATDASNGTFSPIREYHEMWSLLGV